MAEQHGEARFSAKAHARQDATVIRGEKSWAILNTFAGFTVTIEGTLISMVDALPWWARCLLFLAVAGFTLGLIRSNWRVQDWIIGWVTRYQSKPRG